MKSGRFEFDLPLPNYAKPSQLVTTLRIFGSYDEDGNTVDEALLPNGESVYSLIYDTMRPENISEITPGKVIKRYMFEQAQEFINDAVTAHIEYLNENA